MSSVTTRLALIKEAGAEAVDIDLINLNFDSIDANIGTLVVNAGVTPPNTSLFDGAIVTERVTGLQWVAIKNGGGGYDKQYISASNMQPWSALTMGPNWTGIGGTYPQPQVKRINGQMVFSGGGFYTGTIPANGNLLVGSNSIISAGCHPNQAATARVVGWGYNAAASQFAVGLYINTAGQLLLNSPTGFTNLILNLDGVNFRDYNAPL